MNAGGTLTDDIPPRWDASDGCSLSLSLSDSLLEFLVVRVYSIPFSCTPSRVIYLCLISGLIFLSSLFPKLKRIRKVLDNNWQQCITNVSYFTNSFLILDNNKNISFWHTVFFFSVYSVASFHSVAQIFFSHFRCFIQCGDFILFVCRRRLRSWESTIFGGASTLDTRLGSQQFAKRRIKFQR